jgi:hypothetical protein
MKFDYDISEDEIRTLVVEKLAQACFDSIWNGYDLNYSNYDEKEKKIKEMRREVLSKVDWKNAGSQLSETVVQKFFLNLLDKGNR